jgi:hypothetical protein
MQMSLHVPSVHSPGQSCEFLLESSPFPEMKHSLAPLAMFLPPHEIFVLQILVVNLSSDALLLMMMMAAAAAVHLRIARMRTPGASEISPIAAQ